MAEAKITQEELALRLGRSQATISERLNGDNVTTRKLEELAEEVGIELRALGTSRSV
jgi:transcriptional regulator with XRE-family HTH domain